MNKEISNKNKLILKASAGTGKTYTLSLKYIIALCKGIDYKNILVMTFTKKATAEIKEKILERMEELLFSEDNSALIQNLKDNNDDKNFNLDFDKNKLEKLKNIYFDMQKNKDKIKIYTIDSFMNIIFKNIVSKYKNFTKFSTLGEDDNKRANQKNSDFYYKKILEEVFKNKNLFDEFKDFLSDNSEKEISNYILVIKELIENRWKYLVASEKDETFFDREKLEIKVPAYKILEEIFDFVEKDCGKEFSKIFRKSGKDLEKIFAKKGQAASYGLLASSMGASPPSPYNFFEGEATPPRRNGEQQSVASLVKLEIEKNRLSYFKENPISLSGIKKDEKEHVNNLYEKFQESLAKEIYNEVILTYEKKLLNFSGQIFKIYDNLKFKEKKFSFTDITLYSYMTIFDKNNLLLDMGQPRSLHSLLPDPAGLEASLLNQKEGKKLDIEASTNHSVALSNLQSTTGIEARGKVATQKGNNPQDELAPNKSLGVSPLFFEMLDMNIDAIFIDEFQDTSVLQWKILNEIIKKTDTVICVGDEKQSIYGWRGGEKRLFENLESIISGKESSLKTSYRSDKNIIKYINSVFNKTSEFYPNWKYENCNCASDKDGYVKFSYIERLKEKYVDKNGKEKEKNEEADKYNKRCYSYLVNQIKKLNLKSYDDIAIIGRKNKSLDDISNLLEKENIPYTLYKPEDTYENPALFEFFEFLKYLLLDDELAFFNFVSSDIGKFKNINLSEIEILLKNKVDFLNYLKNSTISREIAPHPTINNTYLGVSATPPASQTASRPLGRSEQENIYNFLDQIKKFKLKIYDKNISATEFIYNILLDFNFIDIFTKDNNLKNIFELYLLSKKFNNIAEFFEAYQKGNLDFTPKISKEKSKGIELMTIHKSKGLQFRTVFYLELAKSKRLSPKEYEKLDFLFNMDSAYENIDFSLFFKKKYKTILDLCFPEIFAEYDKKLEEEEINNKYVALTRAKNNLFYISQVEEDLDLNKVPENLENNILATKGNCGDKSPAARSYGGVAPKPPKKIENNSLTTKSDIPATLFGRAIQKNSLCMEKKGGATVDYPSFEENYNINLGELKELIKLEFSNKINKFEDEINDSKFLLETEEKRKLGILIHYFLENIKFATEEEINFSKKLCYKNYISYFGKEKLDRIFSQKNMKEIFEKDTEIFSKKWDYIFSEYELYDKENKNRFRIDRLMIKDEKTNEDGSFEKGEVYIIDYKTGQKNDEQLENYKNLLLKNFPELKNYKVRIKFIEFNIIY